MNKNLQVIIIILILAIVSVCFVRYYTEIMTALAPISEFGAKIITNNGW